MEWLCGHGQDSKQGKAPEIIDLESMVAWEAGLQEMEGMLAQETEMLALVLEHEEHEQMVADASRLQRRARSQRPPAAERRAAEGRGHDLAVIRMALPAQHSWDDYVRRKAQEDKERREELARAQVMSDVYRQARRNVAIEGSRSHHAQREEALQELRLAREKSERVDGTIRLIRWNIQTGHFKKAREYASAAAQLLHDAREVGSGRDTCLLFPA